MSVEHARGPSEDFPPESFQLYHLRDIIRTVSPRTSIGFLHFFTAVVEHDKFSEPKAQNYHRNRVSDIEVLNLAHIFLKKRNFLLV